MVLYLSNGHVFLTNLDDKMCVTTAVTPLLAFNMMIMEFDKRGSISGLVQILGD